MPYLGFRHAGDGLISQVLIEDPEPWLAVGNRILVVDGRAWSDLENDINTPYFTDVDDGDLST
jgi:hypothetical protein